MVTISNYSVSGISTEIGMASKRAKKTLKFQVTKVSISQIRVFPEIISKIIMPAKTKDCEGEGPYESAIKVTSQV